MAVTVQTSEPASFTVGDTVKWSLAFSGYTPGVDTVTAGFSGPTRFTLTATVDPADVTKFLFTITPTTNVLAGEYVVATRATAAGGDVETLTIGIITALPQVGATNAELDTLEAQLALAKTAYYQIAKSTRTSVSVDGVSYTNRNARELWEFIAWLERRIAQEKNKIASALGRGTSGLFVTRFRN